MTSGFAMSAITFVVSVARSIAVYPLGLDAPRDVREAEPSGAVRPG